jgi:hypothetical protein
VIKRFYESILGYLLSVFLLDDKSGHDGKDFPTVPFKEITVFLSMSTEDTVDNMFFVH